MDAGRRMLRRGAMALTTVAMCVLAAGAPSGAADAPWWDQRHADVQVNGYWVPIVGDFAGSADDDIIWYRVGSTPEQIWVSNGDATFAKRGLGQGVSGRYWPLVGNFGGDERDDIFWYAAGPAADSLWIGDSTTGRFRSVPFNVSGDYFPTVLTNTAARDAIVFYGQGPQQSVWTFVGDDGVVDKNFLDDSGGPAIEFTGDFNGDGYGDFFQYGIGSLPDLMNLGQANGTYISQPQQVYGDYYPVVADLDAGGDGRDDILWYNLGYSGGKHIDPLWHGTADGQFDATFPDLRDGGFPLLASSAEHFVEIGNVPINANFDLDDRVWYVDGSGEHERSTANARFAKGQESYIVTGSFTGGTPDLFRFVPGPGRDVLYTR